MMYGVWVGLKIMRLQSLIQLKSIFAPLQSMVQVSAIDSHLSTTSVGLLWAVCLLTPTGILMLTKQTECNLNRQSESATILK